VIEYAYDVKESFFVFFIAQYLALERRIRKTFKNWIFCTKKAKKRWKGNLSQNDNNLKIFLYFPTGIWSCGGVEWFHTRFLIRFQVCVSTERVLSCSLEEFSVDTIRYFNSQTSIPGSEIHTCSTGNIVLAIRFFIIAGIVPPLFWIC